MSHLPSTRMSVDEFLVWAEDRPGRYELVEGRVIAMAPERVRHAQAKFASQAALLRAIVNAGVPCRMLPEGVTVRIDPSTAYEPDALVYCGPPLRGDAIEVPEPVVVVEVLAPSTRGTDAGAKFAGYFALPSVRHYILIDPDRRRVVHHSRTDDGDLIASRIFGSGALRLDPPGLDVSVDDLLGGAAAP